MSYGIEFRNADGSLSLRLDECFPQTVYQEKFSGDFSGNINIPEFDSDRGMFYVEFRMVKHSQIGGVFTPLADSAVRGFGAGLYNAIMTNPVGVPSLSWNNSTKTMTISPAVDLGFGYTPTRSPYFLRCLHFKRVN